MNFFTVGFLLANLQLDLGLWVGYAIKFAGGLFMLMGIQEAALVDECVVKLKALGISFTVLAGASAASVKIFQSAELSNGEDIIKIVSIICGVLTTAAAGLFFRKLLIMLRDNPGIADNVPEVGRLKPKYDRMLIVLAVVLIADAVNRFAGVPAGTAKPNDEITVADIMGVIMYFTKIISYVYLLICTLGFNKLRMSFNSAHPAA